MYRCTLYYHENSQQESPAGLRLARYRWLAAGAHGRIWDDPAVLAMYQGRPISEDDLPSASRVQTGRFEPKRASDASTVAIA
jgi:hypothetical protein